jgi:hypothetical protein
MAEKKTPTVPPWLNTLMRLVLRSPLHWLVSDKVMLVSFVGRKSGREYTIPVSYMRSGNTITLFTHATWWRNLVGGAPVTLYIKGKKLQAKAEAIVADQEGVAAELTIHLLRNHFDAQFYHVTYDPNGRPNSDEVRRGAEGVVVVRFRTA